MNLVEWNPYRDLDNFFRGKDLFENFPAGLFKPTGPKVDIYQTDKDIVVKAEVPGTNKEDLHVFVDEHYIRLSGETKKFNEFKDENTFRTERHYGSFSRTIPLPVGVKSDQARAEYRDGILSITVPKIENTNTRGKRIEIQ
ncbi:MAG: Hsp20/alpha crystallin family protein [Bacillota bacterium]